MDTIIYDVFKIREYMIKNKLTKSVFCKKCGISTYTYDKIFKHNPNLSIIALFKIAREMKLYICDLLIK